MAEIAVLERAAVVRHGRRLEYFTIAWNALEGLVAVVAGAIAGSISLVGFGIDSFIEVTSGTVLLWRMSVDADVERPQPNERRALSVVGVCFLLLAAYIAYESALDLWSRRAPEHSIPAIVLACVALVVMPLLSRAKRKVGTALGSAATHADAKQTEFCTYLSAILLLGLLANAFLGLWWADLWRPSLWFPSSRKKESKDWRAKPASAPGSDLSYFAGSTDSTVRVSPFNVPFTVTFCAAYLSSSTSCPSSVYTFLPATSAYLVPCLTQYRKHSAAGLSFIM